MLKIGLERGSSSNRYIYTYVPESDTLTLDATLDSSLARVSITCGDEFELESTLPVVVRGVSAVNNCKWQILTGWSESDPYVTPARARLREKKLVQRGYRFVTTKGLRIGASELLSELDDFSYEQLVSRTSYALCTESDMFASEEFEHFFGLVQSSARSLPAPSSSSMLFIANTKRRVLFVIIGHNVRPGIVIVAGMPFELDRISILKDASNSIFEGVHADEVWSP